MCRGSSCCLGLLLHLWAFRTPLMAHTHTYSPTRRRGDQEGREGLFGARTTMQEGARCPSQETDRSAGARCFALQGIRILLPWERPHWHNDEAWSPDPACARAASDQSGRFLRSTFCIPPRAPRRGQECRRSVLRCSDARRATSGSSVVHLRQVPITSSASRHAEGTYKA